MDFFEGTRLPWVCIGPRTTLDYLVGGFGRGYWEAGLHAEYSNYMFILCFTVQALSGSRIAKRQTSCCGLWLSFSIQFARNMSRDIDNMGNPDDVEQASKFTMHRVMTENYTWKGCNMTRCTVTERNTKVCVFCRFGTCVHLGIFECLRCRPWKKFGCCKEAVSGCQGRICVFYHRNSS